MKSKLIVCLFCLTLLLTSSSLISGFVTHRYAGHSDEIREHSYNWIRPKTCYPSFPFSEVIQIEDGEHRKCMTRKYLAESRCDFSIECGATKIVFRDIEKEEIISEDNSVSNYLQKPKMPELGSCYRARWHDEAIHQFYILSEGLPKYCYKSAREAIRATHH